jgi:hypothetical protein
MAQRNSLPAIRHWQFLRFAYQSFAGTTSFKCHRCPTGLTGGDGDPLMFSPHDFRRIFVTTPS